MNDKRARLIQWTALLGCGIIATQIAAILFKGEAYCLNQGCKIVESLTTIPPFYLNLAGFLYFLAVFAIARRVAKHPPSGLDWLNLLLLIGLAGEGVLLSYQLFVAQAICSYCLIILALVVLLNIIRGRTQLMFALPIFIAVLAASASLNFGAARIMIQSQNLAAGTFAVKTHKAPSEKLYLFFSSDCPHCLKVLDTIGEEMNCEINFNPIDRFESLGVGGLTYFPDYNPALNRLLLSLLDIKTIPVLMADTERGPALIKGEQAIIDYIDKTCFTAEIDPYSGTSHYDESANGFSTDAAPDGECEIEVECPDDIPEQPLSADEY
jgi:uncharacterized membrane protein